MVHVLDLEVGPKGTKSKIICYHLAVTNNKHGRNEGWFN